MRLPRRSRVLIVASQAAASPELIQAVAQRAQDGPCMFTLLVPGTARVLHRAIDPDYQGCGDAEARLEAAIPILSEAAGDPIIGVVGSSEPLLAVQDALNLLGFDEAIISMLPLRESRWSDLDLPRKVRALGVPVTEVICSERQFDGTAA
jgi:hypothetical protein